MWKENVVELRGLVEPGGKRAHRASQIVEKLKDFPTLISELKNLVEPGGETAHRTAQLLSSLLALPEWIDGEHGGLRDDAERELDRLCRMIAITLDELLAMIKWFPNVERWAKADLVRLRDDAVRAQRIEDTERRRCAFKPPLDDVPDEAESSKTVPPTVSSPPPTAIPPAIAPSLDELPDSRPNDVIPVTRIRRPSLLPQPSPAAPPRADAPVYSPSALPAIQIDPIQALEEQFESSNTAKLRLSKSVSDMLCRWLRDPDLREQADQSLIDRLERLLDKINILTKRKRPRAATGRRRNLQSV